MSLISRKLREFLARERSRAEIEAMSDAEVAELGFDRVDLQGLAASRPGMRGQMLRMAERFGLSEADVSRPRWRALEVAHACRTCQTAQACQRYLTGTGDGRFGPQDCANAQRYQGISVGRL